MAESEGMLPTRLGKLNAAIKDFRNHPSPTIETETFINIMNKHGLDYKSLTQTEFNYILEKVRQ